MHTALVIAGPDVAEGPLALLSGSFDEKVAKAADLGCDGVELMVRDPADIDVDTLTRTLDRVGLTVPQIVTGELYGADGLCLVTADETIHQRAVARSQAIIDLAAHLGAIVNVGRLRGRLAFLGDVAEPRAIALERLAAVADYAAARGVRLALEPLNRYETDFIFNAHDGRAFVEDLGRDNVGLMLDVFHMNIEDASIAGGLRHAGDRLWHVHIADSNRLAPGRGHLDLDGVVRTLVEMGYDGTLSGEMLPLPDPDTAARETMDFLRHCVADQP